MLALVLLLVLPLPGAHAQTDAESGAGDDETPEIPATLATPRATMNTYLAAMGAVADGEPDAIDGALATLDLSEINPLVRTEKGRELAYTLREVLDRTRIPNPRRIPARSSGAPYVYETYDAGEIAIAFSEDEGWRFSTDTVAALPVIFEEVADRDKVKGADENSYMPLYLRIRSELPGVWKSRDLVLERWQWLGILVIVAVGVVLDKLVSMFLSGAVGIWSRRFGTGAFRELDHSILRPFGLMVMALVWWAGLNLLGLPDGTLAILLISVKFLACLSAVWGAYRLVDVLGAFLRNRASATGNKLDDALVPLLT
ncbi:MAG: mechanosensitive ion channel family protein, partial [Gammaproteobacteria bacterium]|nr:mechanosensitive ion channel family protein [Gammaproteobacteria bacterium]